MFYSTPQDTMAEGLADAIISTVEYGGQSSEFILFESHIQETSIIPLSAWQIPRKGSSSVHYAIVPLLKKGETSTPNESESIELSIRRSWGSVLHQDTMKRK